MGNISYTKSHAFILNHKYHKTITDIGIFRNSYNNFAYILIPITNLCLLTSLVCRTELLLILITNLYLLGSYTYSRLILIRILYLQQAYPYSDLILIAGLFLCRSPIGHILMLVSDVYLFKSPKGHILRTYTCNTPNIFLK